MDRVARATAVVAKIKSELDAMRARGDNLGAIAYAECRLSDAEYRLDLVKELAAADRHVSRAGKRLNKRATKDIASQPAEWRRRPTALPPPIEQPTVTTAPANEPATPRDGLIPGTWTVMDPLRLSPLLDAEPLPPRWTWRHVGQRLLDAYATLRALPEGGRPKAFGSAWPSYRPEAGDLALQAGQGTLSRSVGRRAVGAIEVELMDEALLWAPQYLSHIGTMNLKWMMFWVSDPDSDIDASTAPREYFEAIAIALNAAHEVVR